MKTVDELEAMDADEHLIVAMDEVAEYFSFAYGGDEKIAVKKRISEHLRAAEMRGLYRTK